MTIRWATKTVLLALLLALPVALPAQEVLTNETVVNMAKAKLGDKLITDMIHENPGRFVMTSSALIALKQQGVSDTVIAAMRAKMAGNAPPPLAAPSGKASSREQMQPRPHGLADGKWTVDNAKDDITGDSHLEATMRTPVSSNGRTGQFRVTATCSANALAFKIVYLDDAKDPKLGYKMSDGNLFLSKPHVVMRLSLDGKSGSAPSITSDFINEASLVFIHQMSDKERAGRREDDAIPDLAVGLVSLIGSRAEPAEVFNAKLLKVELPLNNGDLPILEIRPQDPEFQKFAARCNTGPQPTPNGTVNTTSSTQARTNSPIWTCEETLIYESPDKGAFLIGHFAAHEAIYPKEVRGGYTAVSVWSHDINSPNPRSGRYEIRWVKTSQLSESCGPKPR